MLVLTRKAGERVVIGKDVVLTVVALEGNRVRIGLEAPADVRILRGELAFWLEEPAEPEPVAARRPIVARTRERCKSGAGR